jgi:hypothetical protein
MAPEPEVEMQLNSTPDSRPLGPYSGPRAIATLDGRCREAKLMAREIAELTVHVGGDPSAVQKRLIQRAAVLALRLALLDARSTGQAGMSEKDAREYLAWHNSYTRTLAQLGLKAARVPTLAETAAAVDRQNATQAASVGAPGAAAEPNGVPAPAELTSALTEAPDAGMAA